MSSRGQVFAIVATVVAALGMGAAASPVLAVDQVPSLFDLMTGDTSFSEIWTDGSFETFAKSTGSSTIPCVDPQQSPNCGAPWVDFRAFDLNGDGSSVVGGIQFNDFLDDQNRRGQAAVWKPDLGGFVLLGDTLIDPDNTDPNSFFTFYDISPEDLDELSYQTVAFDIASVSQRIVGTGYGDYQGEVVGNDFFTWQLPLVWNTQGDGWDNAAILPMPVEELSPGLNERVVGAAFAISDHAPEGESREYIAGFTGISQTFDSEGSPPSNMVSAQATLWIPDGDTWNPIRLGTLDDCECEEQSMANDVNDEGNVVGWSGFAGSFDSALAGQGAGGLSGWSINGSSSGDWEPLPFVWTLQDETMRPLAMTDQDAVEYGFGEGRAISNNDKVAVGWVAEGVEVDEKALPPAPNAAAWINDGNWEEDHLVNLDPALDGHVRDSLSIDNLTSPRVGSMAEAVDETGHLVVGKALYDFDGDERDVAVYWQLDDDGNVVRGAGVEEDLIAAGVDMTGAEFVDPGNDNVELTDATAVRMVTDPNTGKPTAILVTGTGQGSFGSWIAILNAKVPGVTTPTDIATSLIPIDHGSKGLAGEFGSLADQQYCTRPTGTSVAVQPWCFFTTGHSSAFSFAGTSSGGEFDTQFGIAKYLDEDTSIGASAGFDPVAGDVPGHGSYSSYGAVVGGYVAHEPDQGFQGRASVALGAIIDATFTRIYKNGAGTATSTGHTSGFGFGAEAYGGYKMPLDDATDLIPYMQLRLADVSLGGYTETGGPFPAVVAAIDAQRFTATGGVKVEHDVNDKVKVFGGASLSAIYLGGTGVHATVATLPFQAGVGKHWWGLVGIDGGVEYQIDPSTSITGRASISSDLNSYVEGSLLASFNKTF